MVAVKKSGDDDLEAKLSSEEEYGEACTSTPTVGAFRGRQGCLFLERGHQVREIFSSAEPAVTITRGHIMGRKPTTEAFTTHPNDAGSLDEAQELLWEDCVKLTSNQDAFDIPPTLRLCDAALVMRRNSLLISPACNRNRREQQR